MSSKGSNTFDTKEPITQVSLSDALRLLLVTPSKSSSVCTRAFQTKSFPIQLFILKNTKGLLDGSLIISLSSSTSFDYIYRRLMHRVRAWPLATFTYPTRLSSVKRLSQVWCISLVFFVPIKPVFDITNNNRPSSTRRWPWAGSSLTSAEMVTFSPWSEKYWIRDSNFRLRYKWSCKWLGQPVALTITIYKPESRRGGFNTNNNLIQAGEQGKSGSR